MEELHSIEPLDYAPPRLPAGATPAEAARADEQRYRTTLSAAVLMRYLDAMPEWPRQDKAVSWERERQSFTIIPRERAWPREEQVLRLRTYDNSTGIIAPSGSIHPTWFTPAMSITAARDAAQPDRLGFVAVRMPEYAHMRWVPVGGATELPPREPSAAEPEAKRRARTKRDVAKMALYDALPDDEEKDDAMVALLAAVAQPTLDLFGALTALRVPGVLPPPPQPDEDVVSHGGTDFIPGGIQRPALKECSILFTLSNEYVELHMPLSTDDFNWGTDRLLIPRLWQTVLRRYDSPFEVAWRWHKRSDALVDNFDQSEYYSEQSERYVEIWLRLRPSGPGAIPSTDYSATLGYISPIRLHRSRANYNTQGMGPHNSVVRVPLRPRGAWYLPESFSLHTQILDMLPRSLLYAPYMPENLAHEAHKRRQERRVSYVGDKVKTTPPLPSTTTTTTTSLRDQVLKLTLK